MRTEMTYEETLELAYPAYAAYRDFEIWADAHCDYGNEQTITNLRHILYAESAGQIRLMSKMFTRSERCVREDLEAMYEEKHR